MPTTKGNAEFGLLFPLFGAWALAGCATAPQPNLQRFEFTQTHMAVPFRIVLYATNQAHAKAASDTAFTRVRELNDRLSDYDLDSELSQLSRASGQNKWVRVSDDLWRVLERAQYWARKTDGAFDVTIGPIVNLWRRARRIQRLPEPEKLAEARARVGYTNVLLRPSDRSVLLRLHEMRIDLGGIAKGFAADEAVKALRRQGIRRALVAAAGDIATGDAPPDERGWRIEIGSLDVINAPPPRFLRLANVGVATSGDVFQRLEIAGVRYSHIVDPRTGIGLTDHSLVSVIARDGTTADVLATAVSVLGPERGMELIKRTRGAAVRILRKPNEKIEVVEFPKPFFNAVEK